MDVILKSGERVPLTRYLDDMFRNENINKIRNINGPGRTARYSDDIHAKGRERTMRWRRKQKKEVGE